MATADTARLVAELTLKDKLSPGLDKANKSLGKFEGTVGRVSQKAAAGAKSFGRNMGLIGAGVVGLAGVAVKSGLQDLATLESAITSVDGAIEQLGLTGQTTGKQIAEWANEIESDVEAAFDDKDITAATATLIRFGKVAPKNLRPAMEVMTDLAVRTGDVESASELLAKALADPAKAAGKLAKQGIVLTKAQQDQIKAMVEANDVAGAQKLILDELAKTTAGAAKASAGPYQDALNKTADAAEDARKALAIGFLPVITKVADLLQKGVSDPRFIANLEKFGKNLAGGLDSLITIATKLPWDTIGTSLQIAGAGARAILDAFVALPPWVQTAVLTGWGLNKLTGGALSGIVGELGKGLIKGVLGMNAGVVNINAGVVNGGGGGGGPLGGGKGFLGLGLAAAGTAGIGVTILGVTQAAAADLTTSITGSERAGAIQRGLGGGPVNVAGPVDRIIRALQGDFRSGLEAASPEKLVGTLERIDHDAASRQNVTNERLEDIRGYNAATSETVSKLLPSQERQEATQKESAAKGQAAAFAIRDKVAGSGTLIQGAINAMKTATSAGLSAVKAQAQATAFAVRDKDLSVNVTAVNNFSAKISVQETIKTQTTFKSYYRTML